MSLRFRQQTRRGYVFWYTTTLREVLVGVRQGSLGLMVQGNIINSADLYERAKTVAWAAVAGSPETSYSLADILGEDDVWETIFGTAFLSVIPLHATLDGCAQALRSRSVTAEQIATLQEPVPAETPAQETDTATARRWLADTLEEDLDSDQQQLMIVDHVLENGWETHPDRLSSLMLAVVKTADAALSRP